MPSTLHELPLLLFREQPDVLAGLLRASFGLRVDAALVEASAAFADVTPAAYAADLVLVSEQIAIVVEAQNQADETKRWRWPLYTASAHAVHSRETWLVVVTFDASVARWAGKPVGTFQGGTFTPCVIGPAQIPRIEDRALARAHPELAVLSALAHGHGESGMPVTVAALAASAVVEQRDEDHGKLYFDAVMAAAGDVARAALEAIMKAEGYEYQSEFARKYVAQGREEGLRLAIRQVSIGVGVPWSEAREAQVAQLDATALETLLTDLVRNRVWPE